MFACEHDGVSPDVMCLAKALGGGVMPIGAFITTDEIWQKAYGGIEKWGLHSCTFGGNTRACAAGIAAINVIVQDGLVEAAAEKGDYILSKLADLKEKYEVIKEVRGRGLLIGLEFLEPASGVLKKLSAEVASALPREYLALLLQVELYNKHRIMTAYTINNPNVVRLEPALNISYEDIDFALFALDEVLGRFESVVEESFTGAGS
jgi:putrescine aminotransferase